MPKKSGGLGNLTKQEEKKDLLDAAFFTPTQEAEPQVKYIQKNFKIEDGLLKKVKLYGIENNMKEWEVIRLALNEFFDKE